MTNENLPKRKSPRAKWHTYDGAEYFVTICTHARRYYFGNIVDGEMQLSEIGKCLKEQIENIKTYYPYAEVPLFVIMPNHLHMIVIMDAVGTRFIAPENECVNTADAINCVPTKGEMTGGITHNSNPQVTTSLGTIIRGLKARVSRYASLHNIKFHWQSRYHDHIVRNQQEMNKIAEYIENNPLRWELDCFHPGNEKIKL
ncbi:MAG: transposase [Bacteroidales bacterium]|nr:transposase [Bacteroidales bacterium]